MILCGIVLELALNVCVVWLLKYICKIIYWFLSLRKRLIDLLLITEEKLPLVSITRIRRLILNEIGEQKIDIVNFTKSMTHPFKSLALESAIRL
jgi:hypothetical protein